MIYAINGSLKFSFCIFFSQQYTYIRFSLGWALKPYDFLRFLSPFCEWLPSNAMHNLIFYKNIKNTIKFCAFRNFAIQFQKKKNISNKSPWMSIIGRCDSTWWKWMWWQKRQYTFIPTHIFMVTYCTIRSGCGCS